MSEILLDLRELREARDRIDRTFEPSVLPTSEAEGFRVLAPVHLAFDIFKDGNHFHLVGTVRSRIALACGRCLDDIELPLDLPFDLLYVPHQESVGGKDVDADVEVEDDDLTTAYYRDDEIDLGQIVLEQFYLALPMKPLCRESCRGLCSACGTNLNTGTCSCVQEWPDPRLEGLRSLIDHGDREV